MKTLCLYILTFLALYNAKVEAIDLQLMTHPLESYEAEIDNIIIETKAPLKNLDLNLEKYMQLVAIFSEFRDYNVELSHGLLVKFKNNNTFSGDELYLIKRTFDIFYKLNSKMMEFGDLYEPRPIMNAHYFSSERFKKPIFKSQLIWISSNLMVLDHFRILHKILYQADGGLRRIVKTTIADKTIDDEGLKKLKNLSKQIESVIETAESYKFSQKVILTRAIENDLKTIFEGNTGALSLLSEIIESQSSNEMAQGIKSFRLPGHTFEDSIIGIFNQLTDTLSGIFGNISGSIKWRKGFLFENDSALEMAKNNLKPMDIILEKSPFVLTDKFIPGHYGHVALYLGTKEQLDEIGMWNHPSIIPHQASILEGKTILEAVCSGVRLNSVEDFMNIDDFTIVRKDDGLDSPFKISEQITRGIDQIGKSYDFNFDISTLDKIVCSELVYIVMGHVNWPTRYRVGRPTITPDDVGEILFQKNTRFKMANYMHSSKRHKIEMFNIFHLADIYNYELRAENGDELKDPEDPTNSFWKKETKCYNVFHNDQNNTPGTFRQEYQDQAQVKKCKTTYKEFHYEEGY